MFFLLLILLFHSTGYSCRCRYIRLRQLNLHLAPHLQQDDLDLGCSPLEDKTRYVGCQTDPAIPVYYQPR